MKGVDIAAVKETVLTVLGPWINLSDEPAWTEIAAWLIPVIAIFLTLFAVEIRKGYRE